ncbi:hypothetical protein FDENT_8975 [Fusarium denticulatum]|uniref:Uncharacterized protein n=1 Tax=Fusarium denticulatum TaxID=48507 RepID=A0A8H5TU38_9HYPO|nr:hypothetical protein FDENT_8975 [Fusarium denticulatum]
MHPHIKESRTSSDTPADDGWGAPPPATDDWQTPQPPIGDESDTSDAHIDDKSDLPATHRYEVVPTPSGASLQCASLGSRPLVLFPPQRAQLQVLFLTDDCTAICIHNDNAVELFDTDLNYFSGVKLLTSSLPSAEANHEDQVLESMAHVEGLISVPALDGHEEASAPFTEYEEPKLGEYKQAEGFMYAKDIDGGSFDQSSRKSRVAWTAAQNKVVNDAALSTSLLRFAR